MKTKTFKTFILLAFKYPPYSGVGANRWQKLTKYLAHRGHLIHVITVSWDLLNDGELTADVMHENIIIHRLPSGSFHQLSYLKPRNIVLKIFRSILLRTFGRPEALRWERFALPYAQKLIEKNNIDTVIATGAPFYSNLIASKLKLIYNDKIRVIQDFRDIWTENPYIKYSKNEEFLKKSVLDHSDDIVCISRNLLKSFHGSSAKYHVIENGADIDDLPIFTTIKSPTSFITITHIGSITNGRERPLFELLDVLKFDPTHDNIRIVLIGDMTIRTRLKIINQYQALLANEKLILHDFMPRKLALAEVGKSSFALLLNSDKLDYALSTKLYEYILLRKPVLSLNYGGEIEEFFKNTIVGLSINLNNENIASRIGSLSLNQQYDFSHLINNYNHKSLALRYSQIIEG